MGIQFHETKYGHMFFNKQLPDLIKAVERVAAALENKKSSVRLVYCENDGEFDGKLLFKKGRQYILIPAEDGYYDAIDRETGEKVWCTYMDLDQCFPKE